MSDMLLVEVEKCSARKGGCNHCRRWDACTAWWDDLCGGETKKDHSHPVGWDLVREVNNLLVFSA